MIRTLIIEDEEPARMLVKKYLAAHDDIEVLGEYADGFSGAKAVNDLHPDLIILDVQMPKLTGFEMLELLDTRPVILFTTAYDQYAVKAFEQNAVDYLMKPFTRERFAQALDRARKKISHPENNDTGVKALLQANDEKEEVLDRIAVKTGSNIHVIHTNDIFFLEAEGDYVMLHTRNGKHLKEKTMKYFESHLDPKRFVRIHRSYIVNVNEIAKIELYDKENYSVMMKNQASLRASSNGYRALKLLLNL